MPLMNWPIGSQGIDVAQGLAQHVPVEEQDRVECLVLRAGRDLPVAGQFREE